jgi:signal transduction histidine kinase
VALSCCAAAYHYGKKQFEPKQLTAKVQQDFLQRERDIARDLLLIKKGESPDSATSSTYGYFDVHNGIAVSWNTSTADLPDSVLHNPQACSGGKLMLLADGYYYVKTFSLRGGDTFRLAMVPVTYEYPIDNDYFHSRFVANPDVPLSTTVDADAQKGAYPVYNLKGKPVFYLIYAQTADDLYKAGTLVWLLVIVGLMSILFWIHECCYGIGLRTNKPLHGWLVLLVFLALITMVRAKFDLPVGFLNSKLFSPELFSSEGVNSLGDFIITMVIILWGLFYLSVYVPLADMSLSGKRWVDIAIRVIMSAAFAWSIFNKLISYIIKLINDSKISFEAGNFSGLNIYTFLGILCLCIISIIFLLQLNIINNLLKGFLTNTLLRYTIFLAVCALAILSGGVANVKPFELVLLLMSVAGLLMIDSFGLPMQKKAKANDLSVASSGYIWFAILCTWITVEIFYFNFSKEKSLRQSYAEKLEQQDDGLIQDSFHEIENDLEHDTAVKEFLESGRPELKNKVSKYFVYSYLSDYSGKYNPSIYYYDKNKNPVYSSDTMDALLRSVVDSIRGSTFEPGLTNISAAKLGNHMYWFLCPVKEGSDTIGYVGVDLAANKSPEMSRRSFLEKKNNPTDQQYYDNYSFAIYRNNTLWSQGGTEIFPYVNNNGLPKKQFTFSKEGLTSAALLFRVSKNELIVVVYKRNLATNVISLFSYVLGVLLILAFALVLSRQLMFYPGKLKFLWRNFNLTIRSKVNITILGTVFASLLVVGIITLSFLNNKYEETQRKKLQELLLYYTQSILRFADEQHYNFSASAPGISPYSDLSYKLNSLAEDQDAHINLYNRDGRLVATSQLQFLKMGLISQYMERDVYLPLRQGNQSEVTREDEIGDLKYQSIYAPIRDKDDHILAYVNLPYYVSGPERSNENSNVLVTLINVYALVFFLSGICAIFISNSVIRSFRLLIDQFRNIRLRHNEFIEWPYKDEIGVLVKEYNAMMRKVEAMAARLARTEREEAWREIAKQVAHEIKNPLTPMKLNIQYLQQAILNGRPDIEGLASRVSETLIEQIENLNLIATEFSNFAKMPEAGPEPLNLQQNLQSLVSLFQKDSKIKVGLEEGKDDITILMDKSYFIRVFTNLIQNAIQAVADSGKGEVSVSYEQNSENVVVKVKDNGVGIPVPMQEKLFLPYFTTKSSGTGLGLSMTKNMVEASNGMIWFKTVEKEGSEFYVQLPIYRRNNRP